MTDFDPITRRISGRGAIVIPDEWQDALEVYLYTSVLREVLTPSDNLTFNPSKSFYAHITFCRDDFVLQTFDVNFELQAFEVFSGQSSQNLLSLICAYDGILDSFVQLGQAISVVVSRTNLIKQHPFVTFKPNLLRFVCFGSSALEVTLKATRLQRCSNLDGTPKALPLPPSPPPLVPPGTPIEVSLPYPDDPTGQDTEPFPLDAFPPPDDPCTPYLARILADRPSTNQVNIEFESIVFTPFVERAVVICSASGGSFSSSVGMECGGTAQTGCIYAVPTYVPFGGASGGGSEDDCYTNARLVLLERQ